MKRGRRWWLTRLGIPLVAGLLLFVWALREWLQNAVVIENRSGSRIEQIEVIRDGQTQTFKDVAAGAKVSADFENAGGFQVKVRLHGEIISALFPNQGRHVDLIIDPGGQIKPRPARE